MRPKPGITVSIDSDALIGAQSTVTDAKGMNKFLVPPTGAYSVTFSLLSGYRTRTQENIVVKIGSTTGVELGKQGTNLNFEFVDEIQVKSRAFNAEFGRATDSVINVITKSCGDEFHGDLFDYFDSDARQAGLSGAADAGAIGASFKQTSFSRSRPMIPTVRRQMKVGTPPLRGRTRPPFVSACACPSNPAFIATTRRVFGPSLFVPRRPGRCWCME